ncbi:MAG TPA: C39 family peptidase [Microlunatus sp.]|nr:C39 family peptidase [Microlunatus sp.]
MSLREPIHRRHLFGLAAGLAPAAVLGAPALAPSVAAAAPRRAESRTPTPAVRGGTHRPATAEQVAEARQVIPVPARTDPAEARRAVAGQLETAAAAGNVIVEIDFQYQETGYWCGPAATRHALSARGVQVSQQQLANELPTTTNGTDWIGQVTRVLNNYVGWYETKEMPNDPPTQAQRDLLWHDIVYDLDRGYALVTNIVAPASNHPPGYPNHTIWHYFTVIGYNPENQDVLIADSAGFAPTATYWLTFHQLATLIPPKGYSA